MSRVKTISFKYHDENRIQSGIEFKDGCIFFFYLNVLEDNSLMMKETDSRRLPSEVSEESLIQQATEWWNKQDKDFFAAIDARYKDIEPKSVNFFTLEQFQRLVEDVKNDEKAVSRFIYHPARASNALVEFGIVWHGLQMVVEHIKEEMHGGKEIKDIAITPDFWRQPFTHRKKEYTEGLYHVVKYAAFTLHIDLIGEFSTCNAQTQLWEFIKDYTDPFYALPQD